MVGPPERLDGRHPAKRAATRDDQLIATTQQFYVDDNATHRRLGLKVRMTNLATGSHHFVRILVRQLSHLTLHVTCHKPLERLKRSCTTILDGDCQRRQIVVLYLKSAVDELERVQVGVVIKVDVVTLMFLGPLGAVAQLKAYDVVVREHVAQSGGDLLL